MDPSEREDFLPKHPGERSHGHGNEITLTLDSGLTDGVGRGQWVQLVGDGTVSTQATDDAGASLPFNAVLKHSAEPGEEVTVHVSGLIRAAEESPDGVGDLVDSFNDGSGDVLVRLR